MSGTLDNDDYNAFLVRLFKNAETEGIYNYYTLLPHWHGEYNERQSRLCTGIFIVLGLHNIGPGAAVRDVLVKLYDYPHEINTIMSRFSMFLKPFPKPISQTCVKFWLGKMYMFGEEHQLKVRKILSKDHGLSSDVITKILQLSFGKQSCLDPQTILTAENWLPKLLPIFPE